MRTPTPTGLSPSPGALADRALTLINQASGQLGGMVIKKRLSAHEVREVLEKLEGAKGDLENILGEGK